MVNKLSYVFVALVAVFVVCQLILPEDKNKALRHAQRERVEMPNSGSGGERGRSLQPGRGQRSSPHVKEIAVCRDVQYLRPIGNGTRFPADVGSLFCFTLIEGATTPQVIYHDWQYKGGLQASIPLSVEDYSWRTWSRKAIRPEQVGSWRVLVRDVEGRVLGNASFEIAPRGR